MHKDNHDHTEDADHGHCHDHFCRHHDGHHPGHKDAMGPLQDGPKCCLHEHHHCHEPHHEHHHGHHHDGHHHGHHHDGHHHGHHHGYTHHGESPARVATGGTVLTVRAHSGLSGDMMLAGLCRMTGISDEELEAMVGVLGLPQLKGSVRVEERSLNGVAGWGCSIELPHEHAHRGLGDIRNIIEASGMDERAKKMAVDAFTVLAKAEAAVHGAKIEEVHFHEVGALDSILDTCLVCMLFARLAPDRFVCSPLPLADGDIDCAHGRLASPAPAVLRLLPGALVQGFAGSGETVTPTAAALLHALGAEFGPWPAMRIRDTAVVYGTKIFPGVANGNTWAVGEAWQAV